MALTPSARVSAAGVRHERSDARRPPANAEGYAGIQINEASAREPLSFLIPGDSRGQGGADFTRYFAVKQMAFAKLFLDSANLVISKNVGD